nr:hypothetical protein [Pseudomonas sp.]
MAALRMASGRQTDYLLSSGSQHEDIIHPQHSETARNAFKNTKKRLKPTDYAEKPFIAQMLGIRIATLQQSYLYDVVSHSVLLPTKTT